MSIDFLITAMIVILIPGTGVVYTVATGLSAGRRQSVAAAFGCTLGIVPAIIASVAGLAAVLHTSALLFQTIRYCGVAYLLYLAVMTLRESGPLRIGTAAPGTRSLVAIARTGCLINVLNPKLSVFFFAFLPQFVDVNAARASLHMLALGGVFMGLTFLVFMLYGLFAAVIGERIFESATVLAWMRRTVAAAFAGFGLRLALSDR